jgi:hypothetical protein
MGWYSGFILTGWWEDYCNPYWGYHIYQPVWLDGIKAFFHGSNDVPMKAVDFHCQISKLKGTWGNCNSEMIWNSTLSRFGKQRRYLHCLTDCCTQTGAQHRSLQPFFKNKTCSCKMVKCEANTQSKILLDKLCTRTYSKILISFKEPV